MDTISIFFIVITLFVIGLSLIISGIKDINRASEVDIIITEINLCTDMKCIEDLFNFHEI